MNVSRHSLTHDIHKELWKDEAYKTAPMEVRCVVVGKCLREFLKHGKGALDHAINYELQELKAEE